MNLHQDEKLFKDNTSHTFDLKTTSIKDIPELNTLTIG
jgi:hypothetical protein